MIKFHGISMPEGAALSWPLSDIVIRRKNGFAFRCRVRGCSLLDQRPVSALPRRRRERYRQTTSPEGVKIGRRSGVKFGSRLTHEHGRMPELAADLVNRRVAVIAVPASAVGALAAKALTTTIPIVFSTSGDPVEGFVNPREFKSHTYRRIRAPASPQAPSGRG